MLAQDDNGSHTRRRRPVLLTNTQLKLGNGRYCTTGVAGILNRAERPADACQAALEAAEP